MRWLWYWLFFFTVRPRTHSDSTSDSSFVPRPLLIPCLPWCFVQTALQAVYAVVGNHSFWYGVGQGGDDAAVVERWDGRVVHFWARIRCCREFKVYLFGLVYLFLATCAFPLDLQMALALS